MILLMAFTSEQALACSNPMSSNQLSSVRSKLTQMLAFEENTPTGQYHHKGTFKVDKCRNITVKYGKVHKGKLHQLFTELNHAHHNSAYFGLVPRDEWGVYDNGILVFHQEDDPSKMANWLVEINRKAVELLNLAGYSNDPSFQKRKELLEISMKTFGRPQFSDAVKLLIDVWKRANP